jgi:hypothetical protein
VDHHQQVTHRENVFQMCVRTDHGDGNRMSSSTDDSVVRVVGWRTPSGSMVIGCSIRVAVVGWTEWPTRVAEIIGV